MVNFRSIEKKNIFESLASHRVVCFGLGRRFEYFRKNYPQIPIAAVLDNYKSISSLELDNKLCPVLFPEDFRQTDQNMVVVITSVAIDEIIEQMDKMKQFDGILCYAEVMLDDYAGLNDVQSIKLQDTVLRLAHRTDESILGHHYGKANLSAEIKKFQIWEYFDATNTGGSKARADIKQIIGNMGYQVLNIHCSKGEKGSRIAECSDRIIFSDWTYLFDMLPQQSILFMQFPAPLETRFPKEIMFRMKKEKQIRFVCLIHDVNCLREMENSDTRKIEFQLIKQISDLIIVHNSAMQRYFEKNGVKQDRLIVLGIFDYLYNEIKTDKYFEKSITIAGNLSFEKSSFLKHLGLLSPLKVHLYGPNCQENIFAEMNNVDYGGSFCAEQLPHKLNRGFGLIWDGNSIDTCTGGTGDYLKYNNPHKMSLYLSAGIPVIIWSGAAQAEFVKKNNVGLVVDSLWDINDMLEDMQEDEYFVLTRNTEKISKLLRSGYYTTLAIKKAERLL